jgi:hypothetical protein
MPGISSAIGCTRDLKRVPSVTAAFDPNRTLADVGQRAAGCEKVRIPAD